MGTTEELPRQPVRRSRADPHRLDRRTGVRAGLAARQDGHPLAETSARGSEGARERIDHAVDVVAVDRVDAGVEEPIQDPVVLGVQPKHSTSKRWNSDGQAPVHSLWCRFTASIASLRELGGARSGPSGMWRGRSSRRRGPRDTAVATPPPGSCGGDTATADRGHRHRRRWPRLPPPGRTRGGVTFSRATGRARSRRGRRAHRG